MVLRIKTAGQRVSGKRRGNSLPSENAQWNQKFFRVVDFFGAAAAFVAALDGAGNLGEMQDAQIQFRMVRSVARQRMRHRFRRGHQEIVDVVRADRVRVVKIHDPAREVGAVAEHAIEMIYVGLRIKFGDQRLVLHDRSFHDEHVHAAFERGANHFAPLRAVAGQAFFAGADCRQIILAIALFESRFDFLGTHQRTVARIFHAVQINAQRNQVPFIRLVFAQRGVVAQHRTLLAGPAQTHFGGRIIRADAREINGTVAGARDARDAGVQRFVQHDSGVSRNARRGQQKEKQEKGGG